MKILYCASESSHLRNFHKPYISLLSKLGYLVDTLTSDGFISEGVNEVKRAALKKSVFSPSNVKALFQIIRISKLYDLVITNNTLAGTVVRFAIKLLSMFYPKKQPKVLHICHGYLFSEEKIKELYLKSEQVVADVTDIYAVMNQENERVANKYKLGKRIVFTHGMGIDMRKLHFAKIKRIERLASRDTTPYRFVYIAEFSVRKNQMELIETFQTLILPNAELVLAGTGSTFEKCKAFAGKNVRFFGYVEDIAKLLSECDCAVSVSKFEGLPFNIMESMAVGLPVIASDIAGHKDLNVSLFKSKSELGKLMSIEYEKGKRMVEYENLNKYTLNAVLPEWRGIFEELLI